jgi:hypothetical protein
MTSTKRKTKFILGMKYQVLQKSVRWSGAVICGRWKYSYDDPLKLTYLCYAMLSLYILKLKLYTVVIYCRAETHIWPTSSLSHGVDLTSRPYIPSADGNMIMDPTLAKVKKVTVVTLFHVCLPAVVRKLAMTTRPRIAEMGFDPRIPTSR